MAIIRQWRRGNVIVFSALEKNDDSRFSSTTDIDGESWGMVGSDFTPKEMLSYFQPENTAAYYERVKPLHELWRIQAQERAYQLIIEQFPHASSGKREGGFIYYKTGR